MSMFRLLVRVSQHLWRQVPLSTLPGGESPTSVLSCYVAVSTFSFRMDFKSESQKLYWRKALREGPQQLMINDQVGSEFKLPKNLDFSHPKYFSDCIS